MTAANIHPDVMRQLTDRVVMPKDQFLTLPDEARMRAFTVAKLTEASALQDTLDAVRSTVAKGGTLWDFKQDFPDLAKAYTEAGNDWHLNLIFQQNARQAFAVGAYQSRQRTKRAFPYVEYHTGVNPRPSHVVLDGKIFEVDDPFLQTHTPPWDFSCNCDLIPRTAAQVGKVQGDEAGKPAYEQRVTAGNETLQRMMASNQLPHPQASYRPVSVLPPSQKADGGGYSFRPDRLNQPVDLSRFDPEIRETLLKQLESVGYSPGADGTAIPPTSASSPGTSSSKSRIGRPSASKAVLPHRLSTHRLGRPVGRVGRPAPQIARVACPPQRKEAA